LNQEGSCWFIWWSDLIDRQNAVQQAKKEQHNLCSIRQKNWYVARPAFVGASSAPLFELLASQLLLTGVGFASEVVDRVDCSVAPLI
jgi:hypothetical protein